MARAVVKICGVTRAEDALQACALGASWLGFNFYEPSPRYVRPERAAALVGGLPAGVTTVGVFVNAAVEEIGRVMERCRLEVAQLHGDETPGDCRAVEALGVAVLKAVRVRGREDVERAASYGTQFILLDGFRLGLYGGSGARFDWGWLKAGVPGRVFLAGGIAPENVGEALAAETYGIDVCSGVEAAPGVKDAQKLRRLFTALEAYYERQP